MLKSIHADLYRIFHRMYFYLMTASLAGICIIVNIVLSQANPDYALTRFSWQFALSFLSFPAMLMPMLVDLVISEEIREHTLKNTLSFGVNRMTLYGSKLITATILGVILGVVTLAAYCGSSLLFLRQDAGFNAAFIKDFFLRVGAACVVYAAGVMMAAFLSVLLRRNSLSVFAYYGLLFLPPYLFMLFRVTSLNQFLLSKQFSLIASGTFQQVQSASLVGLVTLAVFIILGMFRWKRQDIC